jgi:hypothetical protein
MISQIVVSYYLVVISIASVVSALRKRDAIR